MVLKEAEELRLYYEEKNRDLIARIAANHQDRERKLHGKSFEPRRQSVRQKRDFFDRS